MNLRVLITLLVLLSTAACANVLGFDDLSGSGNPLTVTGDGSPIAQDAGDGGLGAVLGDGGPRSDAPDAGIDAPAACSTPCAGTCLDTQTDGKNCGGCGIDCLGGACSAGSCQPVILLATAAGNGTSIVVTSTAIYWTTTQGAVKTCPITGCAPSPVTLVPAYASSIAVNVTSNALYWTEFGKGVMGCLLPGCSTTYTIWSGTAGLSIAVDIYYDVFWTTETGGVMMCLNSFPGSSCTLVTVSTPTLDATWLAVDSASLYWTAGATAGAPASEVLKCGIGGCVSGQPFTVASAQPNPRHLSIDEASGNAYWATPSGLFSCPTSGCTGAPTQVASGTPGAIAIYNSNNPPMGLAHNLYWVDTTAGAILTCPLTGCGGSAPTVLANADTSSLAIDATAVYWADRATGALMRVRR